MTTIQILLIIYVASLCIGMPFIIKSHKKKKNIPFEVIAVVFMPIVLLIECFFVVQKWWYKDKARPLPKKLRKFLKPDLVVVNGETMSISDYNKKYGKNLTLKDVYGSKYVMQSEGDSSCETVTLEDKVAAQHEDYASIKIIGIALSSNDYHAFRTLMTENTTMVLYDNKTVVGVDNIIDYWQDWTFRCKKDGVHVKYTIKYCKWFSLPVLKITPQGYSSYYLAIKTNEGRITHIERMRNPLGHPVVGGPDLDWERLDIKKLKGKLTKEIDSKHYHISCLDCGTASSDLKWYRVSIPMGLHGYTGDMSVCPHCNKIIEFIPEIRYRIDNPSVDDVPDDDVPF